MTVSALARNAYQQSTKSTAEPRSVERQLLTRLTSALIAADKSRDTDKAGVARALGKNLEFWTVIAADVASEGNQLSAELRSQLFYLYEFTRYTTNKILGGDDSVSIHPLIEINQNIMAGLQGGPQGAAS
ncbi:flagellar biosynthesis regulator FlaF [Hyphococcus flavus]|uniref:Flagellar biosynthesis regulator FlaF n=1 Tax=Hyphococcus flavus TaxID=1866326 RepID=A0AAE9ZIF8_9PROT|nr:flagellar biosynthesis regulator FlaF [Hyphococcus flavus]WDI31551.1 flagellar biosynthesis regulator FlaF [Hyphococcus flavus]